VDRDAFGETVKLGGEGLERGYDKSGVGLAATSCGSGRSAGSLRHAVGVRVDAEHESLGVRGRVSQHEPAVTGSQVHRRRGVRRDEIGQLTDVHLGQASSGQHAHGPMIATGARSA
jgi:hypothetical protein